LKKLIECCDDALKPVIVLAVNTGMRKAEIQNLKWRDVNFHVGFIALHHTKNGQSRKVPLNRTAKAALIKVRKHRESPYIFCKPNGELYNFRAPFERALKKASIEDFRFHDLRHTAASYLAMSGVDLNTIRDILGHESLEMVLRYAHLSPAHQANAVGVLDRQMDTIWTPRHEAEAEEKFEEVVSPLDIMIS